MTEYCTAHGKPQPDFHIYYMSLKQNHEYHPKRRAGLLSCHHAHPAPYMIVLPLNDGDYDQTMHALDG